MGVLDDKYAIFRDFKRRVLDKAIEEVNSFSDLYIEPEFQKKGRQITKIRFLLRKRLKKKRLGKIFSSEEEGTTFVANTHHLKLKLINTFKITQETSQNILNNYQSEYIFEKIS